MRTHQLWLKQITKLGLLLMMGVSMSAGAGLFGFGGTSWKEEVLLHDGSKIMVSRSQSHGGRHEVGQSAPIKAQIITFKLPVSGKTLSWESEYGEDIGRANFKPLALHILNDIPYIVASPNLCLSYNKWGRPNPPYVIFKYDGKEWQRIPLQELPLEFKDINLVIETKGDETALMSHSPIRSEQVKAFNSSLDQPEYRTILREPLLKERINEMCMEMVLYKGAWVGPGDSIGKRMMDMKSK